MVLAYFKKSAFETEKAKVTMKATLIFFSVGHSVKKFVWVIFCLVATALFNPHLYAETPITQYSLEDLLNAEVTSVSRRPEPLSTTPAAVYVIDREAIRRSTATKVPELLRNVPGLQVARVNANTWAITARGFNSSLSNKLLVLIDGRQVYSHLHNGVYWDVQDLLIEDIERIEVIRGPGASVWGANAMNGVINIITKHASKTHGGVVKGWGGSEEQGTAVRYGAGVNENLDYRVYGKFFNVDSTYLGNDAWHVARGGFRSDFTPKENKNDSFTFQGDYYRGTEDIRFTEVLLQSPFSRTRLEDGVLSGGNLLARWNHTYSDTSNSSLLVYYDETYRESGTLDETRYAGDVDWQHRFRIGERNDLVWGASYRLLADSTEGSLAAMFTPSRRTDHVYQAFIQDTVTLVPTMLWLTFGSRFELNPYSGFEFQPTVRAAWQPVEKHLIWAAVSRAVRTPSRLDQDLMLHGWLTSGSTLAEALGNPKSESETLIAYETGYRAQLHERLTIDVAAFINDYDRLRTLNHLGSFNRDGFNVVQYHIANDARATTLGAEIESKIKISEIMRLGFGYTYLEMMVDSENDAFHTAENGERQNPEHQLFFHPSFNFAHNVELDAYLRYVDALKAPRVPAYWELDVRLGWWPVPDLELCVVGQSLFHNHHSEFTTASRIQRAVYGKTTYYFD